MKNYGFSERTEADKIKEEQRLYFKSRGREMSSDNYERVRARLTFTNSKEQDVELLLYTDDKCPSAKNVLQAIPIEVDDVNNFYLMCEAGKLTSFLNDYFQTLHDFSSAEFPEWLYDSVRDKTRLFSLYEIKTQFYYKKFKYYAYKQARSYGVFTDGTPRQAKRNIVLSARLLK